MDASNWKAHLYQSYVSSGQVRDSNAAAAEHFRTQSTHLTSIIRHHFPADFKTPIVDIGCGHGAVLYFLRKAGYENARGVDISPEQTELAQRLGVLGVECGDAMTFLRGLSDSSVGVVCLFDVMEHLTRAEAFSLANEVSRVLQGRQTVFASAMSLTRKDFSGCGSGMAI